MGGCTGCLNSSKSRGSAGRACARTCACVRVCVVPCPGGGDEEEEEVERGRGGRQMRGLKGTC